MNKKMREACLAVADCFEHLPECWTSQVYAKDGEGSEVNQNHPTACQWCAIGGIAAAMNIHDRVWISAELFPVAQKLKYLSGARANDDGGRLVAIKMLRLAGGEE